MVKRNGVFYIPCKVNGLDMEFIFDTGASDVSISLTEAVYMYKHGQLKEEQIVGEQNYKDATGKISSGTKIIIKEIEVAGIKINNVSASVVNSTESPLLLGQSAIKKLGQFTFDSNGETITFFNGKGGLNQADPTNASSKSKVISTGVGKYSYTDDYLSNNSDTYKEGLVQFTMTFDVNHYLAEGINIKGNRADIVTLNGKPVSSYIYTNKNSNIVSLWIKYFNNFDFLICFNPVPKNAIKIGETAEISVFSIQDGILFNYPDKEYNTFSGVTVKLMPFSDGTNNYLNKIDLGNGEYIVIKDNFDLYSIKLNGANTEFKIKQ